MLPLKVSLMARYAVIGSGRAERRRPYRPEYGSWCKPAPHEPLELVAARDRRVVEVVPFPVTLAVAETTRGRVPGPGVFPLVVYLMAGDTILLGRGLKEETAALSVACGAGSSLVGSLKTIAA